VTVGVTLLIAVIGFLYLTRGTAIRHVRGAGAENSPISPSEPQFPLSVAMLTGAVLTRGTHVELALDGDETFPRLFQDLRAAQESITFQSYYGKPGRIADELRDIFIERAAAGVRIFVLYDAFGMNGMPPKNRQQLRDAGVQLVPFRPLRRSTLYVLQNRSHVRGVVIDGRIGWTGGFGIDDKWLGDGHTKGAWRDTNVRFEGPAVLQLQAAFAASWAEATGVLLSGRTTVELQPDGAAAVGLLFAAPTLGSTPAERFLAMSIAGAQKTLYITNAYFAPDKNFVKLIADAARRGVDVRLILAGKRTDIRVARLAARARYGLLLSAGVRIWEWRPTTLHAKTFVVDGIWSSVGTMNFDNRSLVLNDEDTLMILDADIGARMNAVFMDDLHYSDEITWDVFRKRPWHSRVGEWGASLLTRVL
jgi:cardiolipin synthase